MLFFIIYFILFRFFDYFFELIELYVVNLAHSFGIYLYHSFIYSFKFHHVPDLCDGSTSGKQHLRKPCICSIYIQPSTLYFLCSVGLSSSASKIFQGCCGFCRTPRGVSRGTEESDDCPMIRAMRPTWPENGIGSPMCRLMRVHVIVQNPLPPFLSLDCEPQDLRRERTWLERH